MFDIDTIIEERYIDRQIWWNIYIEDQEGIRKIQRKPISPTKKIQLRKELGNRLYPKMEITGEIIDSPIY